MARHDQVASCLGALAIPGSPLTLALSPQTRGERGPEKRSAKESEFLAPSPPSAEERGPERGRAKISALVALLTLSLACAEPPAPSAAPAAPASRWAVTAWGNHFEVFPEMAALRVGEASTVLTHVTHLDTGLPLQEGRVEVVLRTSEGDEVFAADAPRRPGIFEVVVSPQREGEAELELRVNGPTHQDVLRGGKVRVGSATVRPAQLVAPAPRGASDGGEPQALTKEEQWTAELTTAWVRRGRLPQSVAGLTRVLPPAGGEATLGASVAGVVRQSRSIPWPYPGRAVTRGQALLQLVPNVAEGASLSALEAELAAVEVDLATAVARRDRLEELLTLEATSLREVEAVRSQVETLQARRTAAERDLASARSARQGGAAEGLVVRAPFDGEVAEVSVALGAAVTAGQPLVRLVRTDRIWLDVALTPSQAGQLGDAALLGMVLDDGLTRPIRIDDGVRMVSLAPELSANTGTVSLLVEAPRPEDPTAVHLPLGSVWQGQVLLDGERDGVVIPTQALVDDGGITVVYLQLAGERFARQPVTVVERQGDRSLVEGLLPGQRLVVRGGDALRRASLLASGGGHGHVH